MKSALDYPVKFDCTRFWTEVEAEQLCRAFHKEGLEWACVVTEHEGVRFLHPCLSFPTGIANCREAEVFLQGVRSRRKAASMTFPVLAYAPDVSAPQTVDNISFYSRAEVESILAEIHAAGLTTARILNGDERGNFLRISLHPFGIHWPGQARWFLLGFNL